MPCWVNGPKWPMTVEVTAPSVVPQKDLISRCCLIHLKNSSTSHLFCFCRVGHRSHTHPVLPSGTHSGRSTAIAWWFGLCICMDVSLFRCLFSTQPFALGRNARALAASLSFYCRLSSKGEGAVMLGLPLHKHLSIYRVLNCRNPVCTPCAPAWRAGEWIG